MPTARDSGICVDNDSESLSSATSSTLDQNQLSYVQRLRKRFECLAKEQEREFHAECNWWLEEEDQVVSPKASEQKQPETKTRVETRNELAKQLSIKSQISSDSTKNDTLLIITPPTPVKSPATPKEYPVVTLPEFEGKHETNDSDSFDSDSEDDDDVMDADEDEVFENSHLTRNENKLRLSRPESISSQNSVWVN